MVELTQNTYDVFQAIRQSGGEVSMEELCDKTGREAKSLIPTINGLVKKELVVREKRTIDGEEKPVTYVLLTEEGVDAEVGVKAEVKGQLSEKAIAVLTAIVELGGRVSMDDLAEHTGRAKNSLTPTITPLVKKGFVEKEVEMEGEDKITYVEITTEGKAKL